MRHAYRRQARFIIILTLLQVFLAVGLGVNTVWAEGPTAAEYGVVLNLSGRQRMLSQKMSKEVLLIALNIDEAENRKNLAATVTLFDATLKGLLDGNPSMQLPPTTNGRIRNQLGKVDTIWADFYQQIQGVLGTESVGKETVQAIAEKNPKLLKEMNKCVLLYEKDASKAGLKSAPGLAVTINLAGKQRMLSQKMSKEFLLIAFGYEIENNKLNLLETYGLFERTLKGLLDGDDTLDLPGTKSEAIRQQLAEVETLWEVLKPEMVFATDPKTSSIPQERIFAVAHNNLPLLTAMNAAVGMYEKEAAK